MRRGLLIGVAALAVVAGGAAAFIWFSGGSGEPSTDVTAPPVVTTVDPVSSETSANELGEGPITFELTSASVATFQLEEDLAGVRTTVVGSTSELAGQLVVDPADPSAAELGTVVINARTFTTDREFRDRAIRSTILETNQDEFEFITFVPTSIAGLPSAASSAFSFSVTGDLTIRTVTVPVTFEVMVEESSPTAIVGTAQAVVLRSEFGIEIPSVRDVANVTDEVTIELFFVAEPLS